MSEWIEFPAVAERTEGLISIGATGMPAGFDSESLQLNTSAIGRGVLRWGAFSNVNFSSYRGGADSVQIGAGVDSGGNAYADGTAVETKADSSQRQNHDEEIMNGFHIRNGSLSVKWNIEALNSRLELGEQFNPKIRAKQLDHAIRKETIGGVFYHNIPAPFTSRRLMPNLLFSYVDTNFIGRTVSFIAQNDYSELVISLAERIAMIQVARGLALFAGSSRFSELKWSDIIIDPLFFAARPTRAAITIGILQSSRLVRPTPTKQLS